MYENHISLEKRENIGNNRKTWNLEKNHKMRYSQSWDRSSALQTTNDNQS